MADDHDIHRFEDDGGAIHAAPPKPPAAGDVSVYPDGVPIVFDGSKWVPLMTFHDFIRHTALNRRIVAFDAWLKVDGDTVRMLFPNPFSHDKAYSVIVREDGFSDLEEEPL